MATLQATTIQSGVLAVKAGTAAGPFIRNIGDTDTGIYKQDANTIGFATGGSQRARLNATGYFRQLNLPVLDCSDSRAINLTDAELNSSNFYNVVFINNGNHFNASTGRFTVPVAGYYHFSFQTNTASLDPNVNVRLRKNGVANTEAGCETYKQNGTSGQAGSSNLADTLYQAAAGDYFDVQVARLVTQGGTQHCRMFIYLVQ
jgi:hypothetical protein